MQFKISFSSSTKWSSKLEVRFYQRYCGKFIFTLAFIYLKSSFLFQHVKKSINHNVMYFFPNVSFITGKLLKVH